jgi:hypothetical protein
VPGRHRRRLVGRLRGRAQDVRREAPCRLHRRLPHGARLRPRPLVGR